MRIGIDGNLLCGKRSGMGTVVYHVLMNYYNFKNENIKIILYAPEAMDEEFTQQMLSNSIDIKVIGKNNYLIWEQIKLPKLLKDDHIDVVWFPYNTGSLKIPCKSVVTINDVIYMKNSLISPPTLYKKMGQLYRRIIVPIIAKKSANIITITEYAKTEIVSVFPNVKDKIRVIYLSAGKSTKKLDNYEWERFAEENDIGQNYILGFGSIEKRKNSMLLLKAFVDVKKKNLDKSLQLILFGFKGWKTSREYDYIKTHQINNIILLDYVSEAEKFSLYANAKMFVFPSLSEGFGMPVLEAFAHDTPVITSNSTSLPEISGDAALLINPESKDDIVDAILRLLGDEKMMSGMAIKGKLQCEKFDWNSTAYEIMKTLIGSTL